MSQNSLILGKNPSGRSSRTPPTRQKEVCIRAPVIISNRSMIISRSRMA